MKASGTRVGITFQEQSDPTALPGSIAMRRLRVTTRRIGLNAEGIESQEVDPTRQVTAIRGGFRQVSGSFDYELSRINTDEVFAMALGSTWAGIADGGADLQAVASNQTFVRSAGSFVSEGYNVNDWIETADFIDDANNGTFRVTAVTATTLTVDAPLVDEASSGTPTLALRGSKVKIGTSLRYAMIERRFEDIQKYQLFLGNTFDFGLSVQPGSIVGGTLDILGISGGLFSDTPTDASPLAAPTYDPFSSFVGSLLIDGEIIACMSSMDFTVKNNRTVQPCSFSRSTDAIYDGRCRIEGNITFFLEDEVMYNKFINEEYVQATMRLDDADGSEFMVFTLPKLKLNTAEIDPPLEGAVPITLSFTALKDPVSGSAIIIQRSADA